MKRFIALIVFGLLPLFALAADAPVTTSTTNTIAVESKGLDVRAIIHDIFTQSKHNYVLEPNVRFVLYLSIKDVEFEEVLQIICKQSNLDYQIQNGIYFIGPKKANTQPKNQDKAPDKAVTPKNEVVGTLPPSSLNKRVNTKLAKTEFTTVVAEFTKQTGVNVELDPKIAKWKLDAFFNGSSLKFVLDTLSKAGGLEYRFTNRKSIEIYKPHDAAEENRVAFFKD